MPEEALSGSENKVIPSEPKKRKNTEESMSFLSDIQNLEKNEPVNQMQE
jgi:hypothetical protein